MSLGTKAVRGAVWTISSSIGARAIGLAGTLAVTRFVTPAEYGEVSVAAVLAMTANQLSTLGVGQYIIARPLAGRDVAFHATVCHTGLGALALALMVAAGDWLGGVLGAPNAGIFLPGLAAGVLIDRLGFMPERLLVRDMKFGVISIGRTAGDVLYTVASVGLAVAGWGAMAIVAGNIARAVSRAVIFTVATNHRDWLEPCRLSLTKTRELLGFGVPLSVAGLAAFAARRWDNLLFSGFFGPGVAGMYNLAYNLADVPAIQIGEQVGDVLLPSFARMDRERRKRALVRSLELLALVVFPLAIGLGVVAPTLVDLLFDERWAPVAPMLLLLSALSVTRPIAWTVFSYLQARGKPNAIMTLELLKLLLLAAALATFGRSSPLWGCGAVGIAFAIHMLANLWLVRRLDCIELRESLGAIAGPLAACMPLAAGVWGARALLVTLGIERGGVLLTGEVAAGAVAYALAALVLVPDASRGLVSRTREAMRSRSLSPNA
jgi:lipopolysaccharide exporter